MKSRHKRRKRQARLARQKCTLSLRNLWKGQVKATKILAEMGLHVIQHRSNS